MLLPLLRAVSLYARVLVKTTDGSCVFPDPLYEAFDEGAVRLRERLLHKGGHEEVAAEINILSENEQNRYIISS